MNYNKLRVIISGGGTGGHVYPALAIAKAVEKKHPDAEIAFAVRRGGDLSLTECICSAEGVCCLQATDLLLR